MSFLKNIGLGIFLIIAVIISSIVVAAIVLGPPIIANDENNNYYYLCYLPHVLIVSYYMGKFFNENR